MNNISLQRNYYNIVRSSYSIPQPVEYIPIDSKTIDAPLPSHTLEKVGVYRHIIWEWIDKLIEIIRKLWPWAPSQVDHRLCEDFILASSGRNLQGGSTSQILNYLHEFLSKEHDVPPDVLKQLKQAHEWAQGFESAGSKWFRSTKANKVASTTASVIQAIHSLKQGECCLIPGGFYENQILKHALYRVSNDGKAYALEVIARDPNIQASEVLAVAGKQKILSGTTFGPLSLDDVTDAPWLENLLSLQLLPTLFEKDGCVDNKSAFCRLMQRFSDKQIDPKDLNKKSYHTKCDGLSRVQNIWSYVHDQMPADPVKKARRKLRLSLEVLFRYADNVKFDLKSSIVAREHLEAGMRRLS